MLWRRRLVSFGVGCALAGLVAWGLFFWNGGSTGGSAAGGAGGLPPSKPAASQIRPFSLPRLTAPGAASEPPVVYPLRGMGAGHPVVITQFASWCGPCQAELPQVAREASRLQASNSPVLFLGVDVSDPDQASAWSFVFRSGVGFPVAWDVNAVYNNAMGFLGPPDTVFVSGSGKVVHVVEGPVSTSELAKWVAVLASLGPLARASGT